MDIKPLNGNLVSFACQVKDLTRRAAFVKLISNHKIVCVKVGSLLCRSCDFISGSNVGVNRNRTNLALEVITVVRTVITTENELVSVCIKSKVCGDAGGLGKRTVYIKRQHLVFVIKGDGNMNPFACIYADTVELIILNVALGIAIVESWNTAVKYLKHPVLSCFKIIAKNSTCSACKSGVNINFRLKGQGILFKSVRHSVMSGLQE